jgi:opacity protein-like surface antigen
VKVDGFKLSSQSFYLAGVGTYPLNEAFSVYGKLGATVNRYDDDGDKHTKLRPMIGAGVGYKFTKEWSAGVEYVYFGEYSDLKLSMLSANLRYHF